MLIYSYKLILTALIFPVTRIDAHTHAHAHSDTATHNLASKQVVSSNANKISEKGEDRQGRGQLYKQARNKEAGIQAGSGRQVIRPPTSQPASQAIMQANL